MTDIFTSITVNDVRANLRCGLMQQLLKFGEVHIRGAMLDHDHTRCLAALVELRRIYCALGGVDSKDSLLGANQIQGFFLGGSLGCDGSFGVERCGMGANGAADHRAA